MNENENTTTQHLWDSVKAVLSGKFIAIQAYLQKQEKSQINPLTPHSSTLAWKIPWTKEPSMLQSMGLLRVGHD